MTVEKDIEIVNFMIGCPKEIMNCEVLTLTSLSCTARMFTIVE